MISTNRKYAKKQSSKMKSTRVPKPVNRLLTTPELVSSFPSNRDQVRQYKPKFNGNRILNTNTIVKIPINKNEDTNDIKKNTTETVSSIKVVKKVPVLKITISKIYNKPSTPSMNQNKNTSPVTDATNDTYKIENDEIKEEIKCETQNDETNAVSSESVMFNLVHVKSETSIKYKNAYTPKTAYTRKGDLSRDNSRNQTMAERVRYLYTKAQRDCDILRIRLKALRERHKQEKEKIRQLKIHLGESFKDDTETCLNVMSENCTKRNRSVSLENVDEEDECEKLLREVKKIKKDLLNPKYATTLTNCQKINIDTGDDELLENDISGEDIIKSEEIINEAYDNSIQIIEDSETETGNEILNSKGRHIKLIFIDT